MKDWCEHDWRALPNEQLQCKRCGVIYTIADEPAATQKEAGGATAEEQCKPWRSKAQWPVRTSRITDDFTTDDHYTEEEAKGVCALLEKNGYGGDGQIFPTRTWVEHRPIPSPTPQAEPSQETAMPETFDQLEARQAYEDTFVLACHYNDLANELAATQRDRDALRAECERLKVDARNVLTEHACGCEICAHSAGVCPATASSMAMEIHELRADRDRLDAELEQAKRELIEWMNLTEQDMQVRAALIAARKTP